MSISPKMIEWYKANGFVLLDEAKPNIGQLFYGARLVVDRGFGGVMLSTRRIGVPAIRRSELDYHDEINGVQMFGDAAIEAWKPIEEAMGEKVVADYLQRHKEPSLVAA